MLNTHEARGFLRGLYRAAADQGLSLEEALYAALDARFLNVSGGSLVIATAANGHSVQFAAPGDADSLSPKHILGFVSRLIDIYDQAVTALAAAGTASPTDAQILAQMLTDVRLLSIRSFTPDFSLMDTNAYASS